MAELASLAGTLCDRHGAVIQVSGNAAICGAGAGCCRSVELRAWAESLNGGTANGSGSGADRIRRPLSALDREHAAAADPGGAGGGSLPIRESDHRGAQASEEVEAEIESAPPEEYGAPSPESAAKQFAHDDGKQNGAGQDRQNALLRWKTETFEVAQQLLYKDVDFRALEGNSLFDELLKGLTGMVSRVRGYEAPAWLTVTEVEEELATIADAAIGARELQPGAAVPAVVDPYEDRHAVDAYEVYQALLKEKRGYSLAGLVREGGSMLISAVIGAGKTTLQLNIARGWALGGIVLGRQCQQSRTLAVVSPKEFDNWCETVGKWGLRDVIFIIESPKTHFGSPGKAAEWFKSEMQRLDCRTFMLDTLFDFYGHSPNSNASEVNREVMNEQGPLLMVVRQNNWSGVVSGHAPKSEAKAIQPRDPEEAFSGANAWAAQHRMRVALRRQDKVTSILSGRGGYGDEGILDEQLLSYDKETRMVELGGLWSEQRGAARMPTILAALKSLDGIAGMSKLVETTGLSETELRAGLRAARETEPPLVEKLGNGRNTKYALIWQGRKGETGDLL